MDRPEVEGVALSEANQSMPGSQWNQTGVAPAGGSPAAERAYLTRGTQIPFGRDEQRALAQAVTPRPG